MLLNEFPHRGLRPDRMTYAMHGFVEEKLGAKYISGQHAVPFSESFEELISPYQAKHRWSPCTPTLATRGVGGGVFVMCILLV